MDALTGMEIFTPEGASIAALLVMRLSGLVWTAPLFSARVVSGAVKTGVSVLLTLLLWPVSAASGGGATFTVGSVVSELLIGVSLGLGAAIFVGAAESAGDMIAVQMGLSGANVVDPLSETQLPVLGQLLGLMVTSLILATGGHLVILSALAASLELLPVGGRINTTEGALSVVRLGSTLLWLGLRFAAPVVAAMMIGNVALGVLSRAVPQLNILMVAFPVQIGIGLLVMAATLPVVASSLLGWGVQYEGIAGSILEALSAPQGGS